MTRRPDYCWDFNASLIRRCISHDWSNVAWNVQSAILSLFHLFNTTVLLFFTFRFCVFFFFSFTFTLCKYMFIYESVLKCCVLFRMWVLCQNYWNIYYSKCNFLFIVYHFILNIILFEWFIERFILLFYSLDIYYLISLKKYERISLVEGNVKMEYSSIHIFRFLHLLVKRNLYCKSFYRLFFIIIYKNFINNLFKNNI